MLRTCVTILVFASCAGAVETEEDPGANGPPAAMRLQEVATGLQRPVFLTAPAGDARLFVVEQPGRIRIIENGQLLPQPFLDIVASVRSQGNEQGLLSFAFHPNYASNGFFYVNYTDTGGDTRVERYNVSSDRNRANAASAKLILAFDQPFGNHNGGHVLFGPDGMFYIPTGDGGSGGDPQGHGQNRNSLLGKILRIDVNGGDPYAVPADNPFIGQAGVRPEIWAYGLRNPWRIAFDPESELLFVADVGQSSLEEVSVVPADQGGINFGWNTMEGTRCFPPNSSCSQTGLTVPVIESPRSEGISITGGYVYRGAALPDLVGHYLYADFGSQWIRSFRYVDGQVRDSGDLDVDGVASVSSFGVDGAGEMYVVSLAGRILKIVPDA